RHGLATLVSHDNLKGLQATAVPALFDPDDASGARMIAHMAKANDHWRSIADGDSVLLIFQGPDAYVSPRLYEVEEDVPTWNYSAVQIRGRLTHAKTAEENMRVLEHTVAHFERVLGADWRMSEISSATVDMYARGTASFTIEVTSVAAAHKMSQDKRRGDVTAVIAGLRASQDEQARVVARTMDRVTLCPMHFRPEPGK
ncbi:FMN-binding negative transcriptional regulator, partial [Rhizobiaceae sp. 2RAB30]